MHITSAAMLANVLRDKRKRKGLSQNEAGKSVGIKQTTVSAFENSPEGTRLETLFKLLAALELELHVAERKSSSETTGSDWDQEW